MQNKHKFYFSISKKLSHSSESYCLPKNIHQYTIDECDYIAVIGGDGHMLRSLSKYQSYNKPFVGINKGRLGFLMNNIDINQLDKEINNLIPTEISGMQVEGIDEFSAWNDLVFHQGSRIMACNIYYDNEIMNKKGPIYTTGICISTPLGSTGLNYSINRIAIETNHQCLIVSPLCSHNYASWKSSIIKQNTKIDIEILNGGKYVIFDNVKYEINNDQIVKYTIIPKIKSTIMLSKEFNVKIKVIQFNSFE